MVTIKSFTDISQSKKLAEILPLESADMYFIGHQSIINPKEWEYGDTPKVRGKYIAFDDKRIFCPCWSLAALLNLLPNEIITDNRFECHYQIDIRKHDGGDDTTLYQIAYGNNRGLSGSWHDMINTGEKENLIDAAFQMICWLKENNWL
jgi:hypothetical protein